MVLGELRKILMDYLGAESVLNVEAEGKILIEKKIHMFFIAEMLHESFDLPIHFLFLLSDDLIIPPKIEQYVVLHIQKKP